MTVDLAAPRGRWDVFVDAATGAPIARAQLLRFGAATLRYDVGVRNPSARQQLAAGFATITASATATTTDAAGGFSYPGTGATTVTATVVGPRVRVTSDGNPGATTTLTIGNGGVGVWANPSELIDAQLSAFVHANLVKTFARTELDPTLAWLDEQLEVRVNEIGSCNSYSTGDDIHFLLAGDGCENTGRVADLVYHEFGHSLHSHAIIPGAGGFDSAMSEGVSDYLAATMVDDSGVGRGHLVGSTAPLRELDPIGREAQWPGDLGEDAETTGLIIGGALWDMRKALIATRGAVEGKRLADDLYYATLQRAADIPSTYAEILAADDDDGDLSNGTPNQCAIAAAFTPHGLVDPQLGLGVGIPTRDGFAVAVAVTAPPGGCAVPEVTGIDVEWRLRGGALQTVALTAAASTFTGSIPTQPADSVVEYRVVARLGNGTDITYPNNPGDPFYQFYVGPLAPLYCTDFEADPFANGWTHSGTVGADDWQWGAPNGTTGNSDPTIAASGTRVVGTDLGIGVDRDGRYQRSAAETLVSPVIATTGRTGVRLQFKRWLSVEDGFYDDARILADGVIVWSNFAGPDQDSAIHTTDREWRFHDVALGAVGDDGSVQISFELTSDQDLQLGGWTIDDFCVLASGTGPVPLCGNAQVETGEVCDDGNTTSGDGCSSACATEIVEPPDDGCCSTGGDPRGAIAIGLGSAILLWRRRRRG